MINYVNPYVLGECKLPNLEVLHVFKHYVIEYFSACTYTPKESEQDPLRWLSHVSDVSWWMGLHTESDLLNKWVILQSNDPDAVVFSLFNNIMANVNSHFSDETPIIDMGLKLFHDAINLYPKSNEGGIAKYDMMLETHLNITNATKVMNDNKWLYHLLLYTSLTGMDLHCVRLNSLALSQGMGKNVHY